MIDFIKSQVFDSQLREYFRTHDLLEWIGTEDKFNKFDNEVVLTKMIRQYKGIYFCFYDNRLDILFKPHYFANSNIHNANDFSRERCIGTINTFQDVFGVELSNFPVVNLEYGVNVTSPCDITDLISYLAFHERNEFRTDTGLAFSKKSFKVNSKGKANKYKTIKAYAKGIQYLHYCHHDTFRFEINSKERKFIRELGIVTMADLINKAVYDNMAENLILEFEKILLIDCSTNFERLTAAEQREIQDFSNPLYWFKVLQQSRNRFSEKKRRYYFLLDKAGNHLKKQVAIIIQDKLYALTAAQYQSH